MIKGSWQTRPKEVVEVVHCHFLKKKSHWGEMASWKVAERVSHPFPLAEGNEKVFSEPLLEDRSKIWDHIWGQMFTKVSRSTGELSADDLIREIVKDAMKVDIFILFSIY